MEAGFATGIYIFSDGEGEKSTFSLKIQFVWNDHYDEAEGFTLLDFRGKVVLEFAQGDITKSSCFKFRNLPDN